MKNGKKERGQPSLVDSLSLVNVFFKYTINFIIRYNLTAAADVWYAILTNLRARVNHI